MTDKSLYDLLELSPKASPEAVRAAYERLAPKFDPDRPENAANSGAKLQYEAIKEAFFTLGNPDKRRKYDARIAQASATIQYVETVEPFWTLSKGIVAGVVVVVVAGFYYSHQKERTRLARVEAEKHIAASKAKEAEANARLEQEQSRLDAQKRRQEQLSEESFRRESATALQRLSAERSQQKNFAERERAQVEAAERRAESQRRSEQSQAENAARQQLAREKAELCRMERERYGRSISC